MIILTSQGQYRGPDYSCPDFDAAIEAIERARKCNSTLRDDNDELQVKIINLEADIEALKAQIADLTVENKSLSDELKELCK